MDATKVEKAYMLSHAFPMKLLWFSAALLTFTLLSGGCHQIESKPAPPMAAASPPKGQPQPKLPTIKLWLGAQEIVAEQALSSSEIETGMMFRKDIAETEGMLFVFSVPHQTRFWMKNTLVPLSCAYIDPHGKILEIHDMKPLDETGIDAATDQIQFVLEMKQGWFERNRVGVGTIVRTERGSLAETYLRGR